MIMTTRVGAGAVRSGEGMFASSLVGERYPRFGRCWLRLKKQHTVIHKKPTLHRWPIWTILIQVKGQSRNIERMYR